MIRQSSLKIGVYVDSANIYRCGGNRMQYDVLREFVCRDGGELMRLNTYVSYDEERARRDLEYKTKTQGFYSILRDIGYKVIVKNVKWFYDDDGNRIPKANSDLDLAVDALLQSENLDRILLVSGDGDFVQVVRALQNKGCRVEVIGGDNVSSELKQEADMFFSAYLIPNLIPFSNPRNAWGDDGSYVRGYCYFYEPAKGFGYMRYLTKISSGLWLTDKRRFPDSPYESAFFHVSELQDEAIAQKLPSRDLIFEFKLKPSDRVQGEFKAEEIHLL